MPNVTLITPFYRWEMIANDPDDNKFVDCGIAGQADYLVTQDRHFDVLGTIDFPKLNVINLETFAGLIR